MFYLVVIPVCCALRQAFGSSFYLHPSWPPHRNSILHILLYCTRLQRSWRINALHLPRSLIFARIRRHFPAPYYDDIVLGKQWIKIQWDMARFTATIYLIILRFQRERTSLGYIQSQTHTCYLTTYFHGIVSANAHLHLGAGI